MRLTLRTLIAWLDDKLKPEEVRTIGQQVAESPYAKELVDRVHRVTRQRRLTVPVESGPDAVDPNLVASYLDNQLSPEQVAEYEKRCLTSDVNLAEVASVHQILSMVGQKAKVPADAKLRMYRLVRGREASNTATPRPAKPARVEGEPIEPITQPVTAWTQVAPDRRRSLEKVGMGLAILALIGLLVGTAAYSLQSEPSGPAVATNNGKKKVAEPILEGPPVISEPVPAAPAPAVAAAPETKLEVPKTDRLNEDLGSFAAIQGIVLRYNGQSTSWDRVEANQPLKEQARLLNLAPFRNLMKLGKAEVDLIDSTEVILDDTEKDQLARLDLRRGRLLIHTTSFNQPVAVEFEGLVLSITPSPGVLVGVEREPNVILGQSEPLPAKLRVYVQDGHAVLRSGEQEEKIEGPAQISLLSSGKFAEKSRQAIPAWLSESAPSPFSKEIGDQFAGYFRAGRPIVADLVEAMDDPQKDVKRLAVFALGSLGDMESVVTGLSRKDDVTFHKSVVEVLRTALARGGDSAKLVREKLEFALDQPWAGITERLLVGFRPEEARDEATLAKLVDYLGTAPNRGTRELALDALMHLTGRDNLEYDPDAFEGKGLKAWQDLARRKELSREVRPSGGNGR